MSACSSPLTGELQNVANGTSTPKRRAPKRPPKKCSFLSKRSTRPISRGKSPRCQHHDDLTAFEPGLLLDLGDLGGVALDPVEEPVAQLLVRHFAAAEAQSHFDLVTFLEEALDRPHFH